MYPGYFDDLDAHLHEVVEEIDLPITAHLRKSSIKSFFNSQMVDVPVCFSKSKSLTYPVFEKPLIKMMNIIMRHGLKTKVMSIVGSNFFNLFHKIHNRLSPSNYTSWRALYASMNILFFSEHSNNKYVDLKIPKNESVLLRVGHVASYNNVSSNPKASTDSIFIEQFEQYFPTFSFYIRKVDKSVRKNSRGKSGKYVIIWKYVPTFRRLFTTIRWFLKDLKFQKEKTFNGRFQKILEKFLFKPSWTFVYKLRRFVHFYVFDNLKTKLMRTLRATS